MSATVSDRHCRKTVSSTGAAWVVALLACGSPTSAPDRACSVVPDPGIPLRSGFVQQTPVELSIGEACVIRAESGASLSLPSGSGPSEYLVAVQSASRVAGARAPLRLTIDAGPAGSAQPAIGLGTGEPTFEAAWASDAELRFRRNAGRALARARARPARPGAQSPRLRLSGTAAPPMPGDTLIMRSSVDARLDVDCERADVIPSVVRAVGEHFAIVEDLEAAGHLTVAQYTEIAATLDDPLFPVSQAYFGSPADLDGNERVLAFVTPIVNRATPRGSTTFIAGFFNPSDLSDVESCPASNAGEVLYILAPDPDGRFGDAVEVEFAMNNVAGVAAHELTHLLNAQQRITIGGGTFADLEESWLDEGLAHTAEMVVGFAAAGLPPGGNYLFDDLAADPDLFNTFHLANFRRAGYYMLTPGRTPALGDERGADPGGTRSLAMRGFSWMLLRWIADHADPGGGGILGGQREESLFRDLTSGGSGLAQGVANVERVVGPAVGAASWRDLMARYALAPLADDAPGRPTRDSQVNSLHLPDIFRRLNVALPDRDPFRTVYPLEAAIVDIGSGRASFSFDLHASASEYVVLRSASGHGTVELTLTTETGGRVAGTVQPQVVIQRTR
jgi:hypothetical protein